MIVKLTAKPEDCIWFYFHGWRWGEIVKRYSDTKQTVRDCTGRRYVVQRLDTGKWLATSSREFKGQKQLEKRETDVKKAKGKGKRRLKIKVAKRKLRARRAGAQAT